MDSKPGFTHEDGTIMADSSGRRIVRNGKEYPLPDEEYKKLHPLHKDVGCTDCIFVQDKENLFLYMIPRELKDKATKRPSFVGTFTMTGWPGHSAFYLFKCRNCSAVRVDYPHGYTGNGCIYLRCDLCKEKLVLSPTRDRSIYKRDNIHIPTRLSRKERKDMSKLLKARRKEELAKIETMGVIPLVVPAEDRPRTLKQILRSLFLKS